MDVGIVHVLVSPAMRSRTSVDTAELGISLPEGWQLIRETAEGSALVQWLLVGVYTIRGWVVEIEAALNAPFIGPTAVAILLVDAKAVDAAIESGGITTEVLRSVPLAEARRVIAEWAPRILARVAPEGAPRPLPERVETPRDYAAVAAEYVRIIASGERRPIAVMADSLGLNRNTVSARIRRARDQGLLIQTETGASLRAELSPEATRLLNETEN